MLGDSHRAARATLISWPKPHFAIKSLHPIPLLLASCDEYCQISNSERVAGAEAQKIAA
jgi:hypothetical protein